MKSNPGGLQKARIGGVVLLAAALIAGCGTQIPGSAGTGSSGAGSMHADSVPAGAQFGLIWSASDSTLRPLLGVPGAARVGSPLFPGGAYVSAAYSTVSDAGLLLDAKGNLQSIAGSSAQPATVARGVASGATISFAPQGRYAIVFVPGAASLLLVSGLTQQISVATVGAGAAIRGAAVSDEGTVLLATDAGAAGLTITAVPLAGSRNAAATVGGFGGMTFLPQSEEFLFADSVANTLSWLHGGKPVMLATHADGLNQPLAVAASQDAHWAVAANRADGVVVRIDLTGATPPLRSTCSCSPSGLLPLAGNAVFELTTPGKSPGWLIEADDAVARVLFIPRVRSGQ